MSENCWLSQYQDAYATRQSDAVAERFFGYVSEKGESHLIGVDIVVAFAGIVTAVSAWSIWGGEMFPGEKDPVGGRILGKQYIDHHQLTFSLDPSKWADSELKRWLEVVRAFFRI